ncbi:hypothetical protein [Aquirufa sp.]|jgi:hypothetical protein|uniref:hypothetical protein n=1 Tax=Aquirufa sp. TaxID=2676249 RepID=UPI0037843C5B
MKVTKQFKIGIISIIAIGLIGGLYTFNDYLSKENRWFYSTATNVKAFDKLYWGMSKEEVERTLGIKLKTTINFLIPNAIINQTASDFNNEYSKINGWPYNKEVDNKIKQFKIEDGTNIYSIDFEFYNLRFYNNELFEVIIKGHYFSKEGDKKSDLYFNNIKRDLTKKYGKSIKVFNHLLFSNSDVSAVLEFSELTNNSEINFKENETDKLSLDVLFPNKNIKNNLISLTLRYKPIVAIIKNDIEQIQLDKF